jgi:hypothetical protein
METQHELPDNNQSKGPNEPNSKQSKIVLTTVAFVAVSAAVSCMLIDWYRIKIRTASLPNSSELADFKFTYIVLDFLFPLLVAGIVFVASRKNRGWRFLLTFCGVAVALLVLRLPLLTTPARSTPVLQPVVHIAGAKSVNCDNPAFTIDIPPEFEAYTNPKDPPAVKFTFLASPESAQARTAIGITLLGGLVPPDTEANRQRLKDSIPAGVELTTKNWRGLSVPTFRARKEVQGHEVMIYRIRVPLKPKAIELAVLGPASSDESLSALADSLLASLDGPTSWQRSR